MACRSIRIQLCMRATIPGLTPKGCPVSSISTTLKLEGTSSLAVEAPAPTVTITQTH